MFKDRYRQEDFLADQGFIGRSKERIAISLDTLFDSSPSRLGYRLYKKRNSTKLLEFVLLITNKDQLRIKVN